MSGRVRLPAARDKDSRRKMMEMDKTFVIHASDAYLAGAAVFFGTLWLMFALAAPWSKRPKRH